MLRLASLMRSAMTRRTPMTLISVVSGEAGDAPEAIAADDVGPAAAARPSAASKSPRRMRPPGPDPAMVVKSIPASCARRRFAGEAFTRPWLAEIDAAEARIGVTVATDGPLSGATVA